MLVGIHALVGGFIVTKIPQPLISYPLILAAHFLMDRIPHWDFGTGMVSGKNKRSKTKTALLGIIELVGGIILCWILFQKGFPLKPGLWGGVLLGIIPDLLEVPPLFLDYRPFPLNKIEYFHSRVVHRSGSFPNGLIPQIIILAAVILLS